MTLLNLVSVLAHRFAPSLFSAMAPIDLLPSDDVPDGCLASVNWSKDSRIKISIKDQGYLNVCWAFVAVTLCEYLRAIRFSRQTAFSAQQLVDHLVKNVPLGASSNGEKFCKTVNKAFRWMKQYGISYESEYQYEQRKGLARMTTSNGEFIISDFGNINNWDEKELLKRLEIQPIAVAVNIHGSFRTLKDGVYCGPINASDLFLGKHALILLGYGKDPITMKEVFIVQNSWGKGWGVDGLGKIERRAFTADSSLLFRISYPLV